MQQFPQAKAKVLVADDDERFRRQFCLALQGKGYLTETASDGAEVLRKLKDQGFDLLTLDLVMPNLDGISTLKKVLESDPVLPVIILTGEATIDTAVEATKLGAFDYLEKGTNLEKMLLTIRNAIQTGQLQRENRAFHEEIERKYRIIGKSSSIRKLNSLIEQVGPTDSRVLILGESGTGKELVARTIHYKSHRREKKFISVDSGTLLDNIAESELFGHCKGAFTGAVEDRKGLLEEGNGGTIFLDEMTNASLSLQAKLLHVIQENEIRRVGENQFRRVDVRILAASNRNLKEEVKKGNFREDLLYRLQVVTMTVPPLRERKDDIPVLVNHFLNLKSKQLDVPTKTLSPQAMNLLLDHDWPGNVRELENSVEKLMILSTNEVLEDEDVKSIVFNSAPIRSQTLKSLTDMTREFKKDCLLKALNSTGGNVTKAAELLQIDRAHLHKLIKEFGLQIRT